VTPLVRFPIALWCALFATQAIAQSATTAQGPQPQATVTAPNQAEQGPAGGYAPAAAPVPGPMVAPPPGSPPMGYRPATLHGSDASALSTAMTAARSGDMRRAESYRASLSDPIAQNLVTWAEIDATGNQLTFVQLDAARRDLAGWPRANSRQLWAERSLESAGLDPDRTIAWFDGAPPVTAEGALVLAGALQAKGRTAEGQALIKSWWRERLFDAGVQNRMLARYGAWLDPSDHIARVHVMLLGPQGPALQAMLPLVSDDYRRLADAVIALRSYSGDATNRVNAVPASLLNDPVLAFERARYYRHVNMGTLGAPLVKAFPPAPLGDEETSERMWLERRNYYNAAIRAHDWQTAYAAMSNTGFKSGERMVEAEFFAGWVALNRLHDPVLADRHFETLQKASSTPITQGRAAYWRARAAEARGDAAGAAASYAVGAKYVTSFYGQLSAQKAGVKTLVLPKDPVPSEADRQRFEARGPVRAARMLYESGQRDLLRVFVLSTAETLPNAEETALLVDLARYYGDQDLAMRVVRIGAQRGFILAERGYPVLPVPASPGSAEPAFALSIARQESNFYPYAKSGANARGMMQLLPGTARHDAARLGIPWNEASLYDAEYNMRLGSYELGEMINLSGGSYVMAAAAYNAGPTRPPLWATECGDPRGGATDPLDFVECIPFTETRNYVMRTLETTQIYRARLNGGTAPLTLYEDLKRGGYGYVPPAMSPITTPAATIIVPAGPSPIVRASYEHHREATSDCVVVKARGRHARGHRARAVASHCPRGVSSHSASKRKTFAKSGGHRASKGGAHAAKHPRSSTRATSAKRAHKHRS
jgi:soluble lytic murein transglycosylase